MYKDISRKIQAGSSEEDDFTDLKLCSSAVLAAQIKKVIPSKTFRNRKSSIACIEKLNSIMQKKPSAITRHSGLYTTNSSHAQIKNPLLPEIKEALNAEVVIKEIPVSLAEKKIFRDALTLSASKTPLGDKIAENVKYWYEDVLSKFKIWEKSLKEIEGYFGAGVVSYFLLLRWLLLLNFLIFMINFFCLTAPVIILTPVQHSHDVDVAPDDFPDSSLKAETFFAQNLSHKVLKNEMSIFIHGKNMSYHDIVHYCRKKYLNQINLARSKEGFWSSVQHFLQGTGWMEPTLLFLGKYPLAAESSLGFMYNIPLAFIIVFIAIYVMCFIMMMNYSSFGVKEALMIQSDVSHHFANDIFSGWDYCIRDVKIATLHHKRFIYGLKSTLSDIHFKKESNQRSHGAWICLHAVRILINVLVIGWTIGCYVLINECVYFQLKEAKLPYKGGFRTLAVEFLPLVSVTVISSISPILFSVLLPFEKYPVRTEINLSLARNSFVGLSSIFVLLASLQQQLTCEPRDICGRGKLHCRSPRCWETYVGQQLYKLNISEFLVTIGVFLLVTIPRHYMVERYNNKFTRLIGKAEFLLPLEVLNLIYLQTITWLGVFYSPLLPAMLVIKLYIMFYIQKVQAMKYKLHSSTAYKASKFNSTYIILLLLSFLIVLAIHFFTLSKVAPSLGCSPFRHYPVMVGAFHQLLNKINLLKAWHILFTGWFFVPAYGILCFLIYYNWKRCATLGSLAKSLNEELALLGEDRQFILKKIEELVKKD